MAMAVASAAPGGSWDAALGAQPALVASPVVFVGCGSCWC